MFGTPGDADREYRLVVLKKTAIVAEKKAYPLRINTEVLQALQRWADDDLRSLNAQIEFVLRESLRKNGRLKAATEKNQRK